MLALSNLLLKRTRNDLFANFRSNRSWGVPSSFGRWVIHVQASCILTDDVTQDREHESRFGATPVPGKIGMAMAGQGLHAAPPPRPPSHNFFGHTSHQNPGNQLYVGNVRESFLSRFTRDNPSSAVAVSSWLARPQGFVQVSWKYYPR